MAVILQCMMVLLMSCDDILNLIGIACYNYFCCSKPNLYTDLWHCASISLITEHNVFLGGICDFLLAITPCRLTSHSAPLTEVRY